MSLEQEEMEAIMKLAELGITVYLGYMKQAGLNQEQIDSVYRDAKYGMLHRDPANIPVVK